MKKIDKTIYFFTDATDTSYIYNDIRNFADIYDSVSVYTFRSLNANIFPKNVEIKVVDFEKYNTQNILAKYTLFLLSVVFIEFLKYPKYLFKPRHFIQAISSLLRNIYLSEVIATEIKSVPKEIIFFSFWFNGWATALAVLKNNKKINSFYSRIHGTDLYEYRVPVTRRIPFRWFQLKHVSEIFSVSKKGAAYLGEKYPIYKHKIGVNYLGVEGYSNTEVSVDTKITIVSCSIMDVIKRVYLIPEILKHVSLPIRWVHFGERVLSDPTDYLLEKGLTELRENHKNIEIDLRGFTPNKQVFEFYKNNSVNLFISVSESEGLPVSMMESIGFGIPIMATDVGGCSEIVNERTGVLLSKNFKPEEAAELLTRFVNSKANINAFRYGVNKFCNENFNMQNNFQKLNSYITQRSK